MAEFLGIMMDFKTIATSIFSILAFGALLWLLMWIRSKFHGHVNDHEYQDSLREKEKRLGFLLNIKDAFERTRSRRVRENTLRDVQQENATEKLSVYKRQLINQISNLSKSLEYQNDPSEEHKTLNTIFFRIGAVKKILDEQFRRFKKWRHTKLRLKKLGRYLVGTEGAELKIEKKLRHAAEKAKDDQKEEEMKVRDHLSTKEYKKYKRNWLLQKEAIHVLLKYYKELENQEKYIDEIDDVLNDYKKAVQRSHHESEEEYAKQKLIEEISSVIGRIKAIVPSLLESNDKEQEYLTILQDEEIQETKLARDTKKILKKEQHVTGNESEEEFDRLADTS